MTMNDDNTQAQGEQAPEQKQADRRARMHDDFAALGQAAKRLHDTLARVPDTAEAAVDRAEHLHALQLADEALKGVRELIETFARATHRLAPFAA